MRTSLNEIEQIEKYIHGELSPGESLVFQAKKIVSPALQKNLLMQMKIHEVLKAYHRRKLKREAERIHRALFRDPSKISFQQNILQFFSSQ